MLATLLLALAIFAVMAMLYLAFAGPSGNKAQVRRLEAVRLRHNGSMEGAAQRQMKRLVALRSDTALDNWIDRILPRPEALRARLERTGRNWTLGQYGMASVAIAVAVAALLLARGAPATLALPLAAGLGLIVPHKGVSVLIARRSDRFTARLPDALELLVRGLRSGLPISETLGIVGSEIPDPVGAEFRGVADRMKIGRTMDAALQDTADRLGTAEFQFFCITLAIQRETGGNLAETLSNLAEVLRRRSQMKLKIRAMSSESKASAYIVGILPFIVFALIWAVNPNYMAGFFAEPRLMLAGGLGFFWMAIGVLVMGRMVRFKV